MKSQITVGILGYSKISAARTFHVPLVMATEGLSLKSIATLTPDEAREMVPGVHVTEDSNEIINDSEIDLVIVALPNKLHFDYARKALLAGKHVVVEKPLCTSTSEIKELIELAQRQDRTLLQYHNRRWDGGCLTVKKLIDEKTCGEPKLLEMNYDRWQPTIADGWREEAGEGSGTVYDLGVHLLDQVFSLFGRPRAVTASLRSQRPGAKAIDYFNIRLDYQNDLEVVLRSSLLAAAPAPRYRLLGTTGSYTKNGIDFQALQLNDGMQPSDEKFGYDEPDNYGTLSDGTKEQPLTTVRGDHPAFYRLLADHLLHDAPMPVSATDAHDIISVVEAAYRSNDEQRTITQDEINYLS